MKPAEEYEKIELTEDEMKAAILEGKKRKYFHEKHRDYWEARESKKGKTKIIEHEEARENIS